MLTLFVVQGLDPVLNLFVWLTQLGTLAVLGLMALTSFAVVAFFVRDAQGEGAIQTKVLPVATNSCRQPSACSTSITSRSSCFR